MFDLCDPSEFVFEMSILRKRLQLISKPPVKNLELLVNAQTKTISASQLTLSDINFRTGINGDRYIKSV